MHTEHPIPVTLPISLSQAPVPTVPAPPVTPPSPRFVPPCLTKLGTIATLTQDSGLGGSLDFP